MSELPSGPLPYMMSYAQQAEDVILRRGLWGVERGFYVDVGAGYPVRDSVTRYFYEQGWCGINIEPQPHLFRRLEEDRPRDVNLPIAIGSSIGTAMLRLYSERWGWATIDKTTASYPRFEQLETGSVEVNTQPLDAVLERYAGGSIDFVKIDVEGSEAAVLASTDWARWQPKIVLVEATQPGFRTESYEWEGLLADAGYRCALFDGLNRYYAHDPDVLQRITTPANTFDSYIPFRWWRLMRGSAREALRQSKHLGDEFFVASDGPGGRDFDGVADI